MRILILEDDQRTSDYLVKGLTEAGHVCDSVEDGRDALFAATRESYDLIIADRMTPGIDGLSMVKAARAAGVKTPVLFLTSIGGVDDRVDGLEAGGDDYLIKPFAFSELQARVHSLGRRPHVVDQTTTLKVADLEMDLVKRRVTCDGQAIDLQPREFALLEVLMRGEGRVITRTDAARASGIFISIPKRALSRRTSAACVPRSTNPSKSSFFIPYEAPATAFMRRARLLRSTPFRLALTFALLFVVAFILAGLIVYQLLQVDLSDHLDETVKGTYSVVAATYADGDLEDLVAAVNSHAALSDSNEQLFSLVNSSGRRIAGDFTAPARAMGFSSLGSEELQIPAKGTYRTLSGTVGDNVLTVAHSYSETEELEQIIIISFGWGTLIIFGLAVVGGVLLASSVQRRLDSIGSTMVDVSHGNLDARNPADRPR